MEIIEGILAIVGSLCVVWTIIYLLAVAQEKIRCTALQWKFHNDAANDYTRKVKALEERMDRLNGEIEYLQADVKDLQPFKASQPKKPKSK